MWVVAINVEELITDRVVLDKLQIHQTPQEKPKVKISLCRRKSYYSADIEEIRSKFDQVRPVVSHIDVHFLEKPHTPKNIGEALKDPKRKFCKNAFFVQYEKKTILYFYSIPYQSNPSLMEQMSCVHLLIQLLRKVDVLMHVKLLHATIQMGVLRFKVLILISPTVQCHTLTPSE